MFILFYENGDLMNIGGMLRLGEDKIKVKDGIFV